MYKDKDKQREANAERQRRYRRGPGRRNMRQSQGVTEGVTNTGCDRASKGVTSQNVTKGSTDERSNEPSNVIPNEPPLLHKPVSPKKYALHVIPKRGKDIKTITIDDQAKSMKAMAMLHSDACKQGSTSSSPSGETWSSSKPKPQSHNPMMVGYVPPKE